MLLLLIDFHYILDEINYDKMVKLLNNIIFFCFLYKKFLLDDKMYNN